MGPEEPSAAFAAGREAGAAHSSRAAVRASPRTWAAPGLLLWARDGALPPGSVPVTPPLALSEGATAGCGFLRAGPASRLSPRSAASGREPLFPSQKRSLEIVTGGLSLCSRAQAVLVSIAHR